MAKVAKPKAATLIASKLTARDRVIIFCAAKPATAPDLWRTACLRFEYHVFASAVRGSV